MRRAVRRSVRTPFAACLFVLLAGLPGCARAPSHAHELRIAVRVDPTSLSPLVAFAQDQIALDQFWCQTLVGLDERNRFVPILLTRIPSRRNGDVSADGTRITYRLRRDVRFADGVPLTSADVAFTFRAIFEPANGAAAIDAYQRVATLTTPDAHTVVVRLRRPWSAAVHVLFAQADFAYGILPQHAFRSQKLAGSVWEEKPFGTGPFRVVAWHRGDSIELESNPYYRPKAKLKRIVVRIIPDQVAALNALRTHQVDVAELGPDNVAEAATIAGLRVERTPENGIAALYLQTAAEPTIDVRVRRAIAYALDPQALSKAWHGAFPAARSLFPPPLVTWRATLPPAFPHDVARAGRELDAAGWRLHGKERTRNGQPLSLLGVVNATSPVVVRVAIVAQEELARLGAEVTIKPYAPSLLVSQAGPLRTGGFTFTPALLIGGSDPEQSINLLCSEAHDGGDNYSRYCSPRLEAQFAHQKKTTEEAQRRRAFDDIAMTVHDEVPLVPLFDLIYLQGVDQRVIGYSRNMLRYPVRAEDWDAL